MFYIISKLTGIITDPLYWITGLLILSYGFKKLCFAKYCFWGAILLFLLMGNGALITWTEQQWSGKYLVHTTLEKTYDFALIQGGFGTFNPVTGRTQLNPAAERLIEPVRLYKAGKVKKLFITGDGSFSDKNNPQSKLVFLSYMEQMGVPVEDIILDSEAQNTRQSALRTQELLGKSFIAGNCLLVTCAFHMPRTLKCYEKVGMHPVPYATSVPVPYKMNITNFGLSSKNLDRWQLLFHEWIGMLAYKIAGYI